jgi:lipopolysaccharide biosynthesis protein
MKKSVICHFFYPEISKNLLQGLTQIDDSETIFFVNIQGNSPEHETLLNDVREKLHNVKILRTPDKGRDIGAKLLLIDLLLELKTGSLYTLIIHDKKSSHLGNASFWREELFKIITPFYFRNVIEILEEKPEIGIVAATKFIQNEYLKNSDSFMCNSSQKIKELMNKYQVKTTSYDFVAGNIFWIRTSLLQSFFENRSIIEIRQQLETGNAMDFTKGTYIHAWERIMSWVASSQGYQLYGI